LLIDSHAHVDSERYSEDRAAMLTRAREAGVGAILAIGIGEHASEMGGAFALCREFNPQSAQGALVQQLEIAAARKRPILIHCRPTGDGANSVMDAWDDLFLILEEHWRPTGLGGVMHCFGGGWEQARRSLDLGFLISFAGNVTYPKAQPLREIAARIPLDGMLVETDAPWLAPSPDRGKRNEPAFVARTAGVLADLVGVSHAEIASATTKNFARLFCLGVDVGNW